jgi:hypothetical protein
MHKGKIDPYKFDEGELILVVDYDVIFEVKLKWSFPFFIKRTYIFTEYNRRVLRLLERLDGEFNRIIIAIPKSNYYFEENVINKILMLPYQVQSFENEGNYKLWLNMVNIASHFATIKRRYYNKNISKYVAPSEL